MKNALTSSLKPLAAAALIGTAGLAHASFTVYTTQTSFMSAVSGAVTDTFEDLPTITAVPGPLERSVGGFNYTASEGPNSPTFYTAGAFNVWLSTQNALDSITFDGFGGAVGAIGGRFFGSNVRGLIDRAESILISATDADGTVSQTIVTANRFSFLGFVSDGAISSLTVSAVQPGDHFVWPAVNNLVLASVVPEPETYALLLAGLAGMGMLLRRRRDY